tara:strand:+ start:203 stop:706 length:504 start_codon:yes stop_codon:yes gene_type:complete
MVFKVDKNYILNDQDKKREKRIIARLNLKRLPFPISENEFCAKYLGMLHDMKPLFRYRKDEYAMKWCLSTEKKTRVFLLIFEANEYGREVYKENVSSMLPEYSYKTVAQIIDDGIKKGYFIKANPRAQKTTDLKIRNIRPSEDLVVEFINWNIDIIAATNNLEKKYK